MKRAALLLVALVVSGCGGAARQHEQPLPRALAQRWAEQADAIAAAAPCASHRQAAALRTNVILAVNGDKITSQTGFYRKLWSLGAAGVDVPLTVYHEGVTFDVVLSSTDRAKLLKAPRLH